MSFLEKLPIIPARGQAFPVEAGQAFGGGAIGYPYAYNDVVYISYEYVEQADVNVSLSTHLKDYMAENAGLSTEFKTLLETKAANGETLTYLVIGDSISTGGDAIHDGYFNAKYLKNSMLFMRNILTLPIGEGLFIRSVIFC